MSAELSTKNHQVVRNVLQETPTGSARTCSTMKSIPNQVEALVNKDVRKSFADRVLFGLCFESARYALRKRRWQVCRAAVASSAAKVSGRKRGCDSGTSGTE